MIASMSDPPILVIDAGLGAFTILGSSLSATAGRAWAEWREAHAEFFAPQLWRFEVTSLIRKALALGEIEVQDAQDGLSTALALEITLVAPDDELCQAALRWASRLHQRAAYDAFYLALADRLQADFWSADQRLVNAARLAGVRWAHWIGEMEPKET